MSSNNFKRDLFNQFARVGKALSNGNRLEILEFLAQGECNVDELARKTGITLANTSQHLQQLRQSGLVMSRKEGLKVHYRISSDDVVLMLGALRNVAEQHVAEVEQLVKTYLTVKDDLEPIPRDELIKRIKEGSVVVLDVRPVKEFESGHVPGAVNVPLTELEEYLKKMDASQEVVAYCRGPHCILAFDAVAKLREQGLDARRMEDGFPEWKISGLPVEK